MSNSELGFDETLLDRDVEEFIKKFKTAKARVEEILRRYPSARNSDTILQFIFARKIYGLRMPYIEYKKAMKVNFETVRRVRQKIQNEEHKFLPTDQVIIKRRKLEVVVREAINQV